MHVCLTENISICSVVNGRCGYSAAAMLRPLNQPLIKPAPEWSENKRFRCTDMKRCWTSLRYKPGPFPSVTEQIMGSSISPQFPLEVAPRFSQVQAGTVWKPASKGSEEEKKIPIGNDSEAWQRICWQKKDLSVAGGADSEVHCKLAEWPCPEGGDQQHEV